MVGNYPYNVAAALLIWITEEERTWRVRLVMESDAPEEYLLKNAPTPLDAKLEALTWARPFGFDPVGPWLEVGKSYNDDPAFSAYPPSFCIAGVTTRAARYRG